jgi:hypothetical protein
MCKSPLLSRRLFHGEALTAMQAALGERFPRPAPVVSMRERDRSDLGLGLAKPNEAKRNPNETKNFVFVSFSFRLTPRKSLKLLKGEI